MRRLPIYFLVDVSTPIDVNSILKNIILDMCRDSYLLECAYLSIITYADEVKIILPLTAINSLNATLPLLEGTVGGTTSLDNVLICLMDDIDKNVVKTTAEVKGDRKPIIFLFADAISSAPKAEVISRWNQNYKQRSLFISVMGQTVEQQTNEYLFDIGINIRYANKIAEVVKRYPRWFYEGNSLEEIRLLMEI